VFADCLNKDEGQSQEKAIMQEVCKCAYADMLGGRVYVLLKGLDLGVLGLGVYGRGHKPSEMEPGSDEVQVLSQGVGDPQK
jgi:hypothetical protein